MSVLVKGMKMPRSCKECNIACEPYLSFDGLLGKFCMTYSVRSDCPLVEGPSADARKWISVDERLPGPGEVVLVYGEKGGIYTAEHNRNGCWPGSFWKLNSKSHHCEPTHWMPLPKPPKEEKDD